MPKKKATGKGKAKTKKSTSKDETETEDHQPVILENESERWVTLRMRLLNWHYMNFEVRAKTSMHLFSLRKMVADRHGGVTNLVICKDAFLVENEMRDEEMTLAEYGIEGAPRHQVPPVAVNIFYDFKPTHQEPLLLES